MTDVAITTICSALGVALTFIVTELFRYKRELMKREQDRKDRESDRAAIAEVKVEGGKRERRILDKIEENTHISKEAFEVANGHNQKIANLTETVLKVAEKSIPQEVHIQSSEADPVHTSQ